MIMGNEIEMITASPQNASPSSDLPEEIIKEILLRLPAKSLGKFRCVSKWWLFLISSYDFAKAHLKFSSKNNICEEGRLIFGSTPPHMELHTCSLRSTTVANTVYTGSVYPDVDILPDVVRYDRPFRNIYSGVWEVGSCNGLICVVESTLILWNPTTRKYRVLPCSSRHLRFEQSPPRFGFGYDELHDDYKVVEVLHFDPDMSMVETRVKVYSLRDNCWKALLNWPIGNVICGLGIFLNGTIHWLVDRVGGPAKWGIVSHDLALETFMELLLPVIEDDAARAEIKVLGGCLSVCCEYEMWLDVWLLKEYCEVESWSKVMRIPFFVDIGVRPSPLLLMVDGRMLLKYGSELRLYDPRNPQVYEISYECEVEATTYFESLISPNLDDEVIFGRTLSEEIIAEILLRLPVKSLVRFKSVSKEWLSLISCSNFVMAHLKFSTENNVYIHDKLIFGPKTFDMDIYSCSMNSVIEGPILADPIYPVTNDDPPIDLVWCDNLLVDPGDSIWFVGSCNGLVCVSANVIILWNPSTRKSKLIPESGTDLDFDYFSITYAFGYDEIHDDYKVVEIYSLLFIYVKIYSLRTNSWKALSNWPGPGRGTFGGPGKFLNGAIHWSVWSKITEANWAIVSLDLATDTFTELPIPMPIVDDDDVRMEVHILGGCLAVHCAYKVHMDIWVMKEYGKRESWTKVVRIPFFLDIGDHEFCRPCPLFLSLDGKILLNYGSTVQIYDPSNPQPHQFSTAFEVEAITYVESLVSPDLDAAHFP